MIIMDVPAEHLDAVWDTVAPMFDRLQKRSCGRFTTETIRKRIENRDHQLYLILHDREIKAAIVTTHMTHDTGIKEVRVVYAAGADYKRWAHPVARFLESNARKDGIEIVSEFGREGWGRVFAPLGYRKSHVLIQKVLQ